MHENLNQGMSRHRPSWLVVVAPFGFRPLLIFLAFGLRLLVWRCTQYSVTIVVLSIVVVTIVALSIVVVLSTQHSVHLSTPSRKSHCIVIVKRIGLVDIGLIAGHDTPTRPSSANAHIEDDLTCLGNSR